MQDANCQTDTPVASDDDNTIGADESVFGSITVPDTLNVTATSSPTLNMESPSHSSPSSCHNYSTASIHKLELVGDSHANISIDTSSESDQMPESSFETIVSSTNMLEDEQEQPSIDANVVSNVSNANTMSPKSSQQPDDQSTASENVAFSTTPTENSTPDISGLVLLTKSIEALENEMPNIKQEAIQVASQVLSTIVYEPPQVYASACPTAVTNNICQSSVEEPQYECRSTNYIDRISSTQTPQQIKNTYANEALGGLNLLCALAEQHFQNEVRTPSPPPTRSSPSPPLQSQHTQARIERKRSQSTDCSESKRPKKHKEKHTSKKAKKRERKEKKRQRLNDPEQGVAHDFRDTFDQIKEKYVKCDCQRSATGETCHCKVNFPTIEEVCSAMKVEMRNQLADIKRRVKEEERKLDAINSKEQQQKQQRDNVAVATVNSSDSKTKLSLGFSSSLMPTWSMGSSPKNTVEFASNGKYQSDSESSSSTSSKQKLMGDSFDFPSQNSKKSIGFSFATKKRPMESTSSAAGFNSDASIQTKRNKSTIKNEIYDFDENMSHSEVRLFGSFSSNNTNRNKNHLSSAINEKATTILKPSALSKHNKKDKNDAVDKKKTNKQQRRANKLRERKRHIDQMSMMTSEHLDSLADGKNQRILTAMGGLFYAGYMKAVRAPDLYGVTLDGERGNKTHIMSREDILRDVVCLLNPNTFECSP